MKIMMGKALSSMQIKVLSNSYKAIENELNYPGEIKVSVIREMRAIEFAR